MDKTNKNKNKGNPYGETEAEMLAWARGRDEGIKHREPSEKTIELFEAMGDKFDSLAEKVNAILIKMEGLPQAIMEKTDEKYACKKTENDLRELQNKIETRNYDWLKYLLTAIGSLAIGLLMSKLTR